MIWETQNICQYLDATEFDKVLRQADKCLVVTLWSVRSNLYSWRAADAEISEEAEIDVPWTSDARVPEETEIQVPGSTNTDISEESNIDIPEQ